MQPDNQNPNLPTEPVLPTSPVMPNEVQPAPASQPAAPVVPTPPPAPQPMAAPAASGMYQENNPLGLAITGLVIGLLFPPIGLVISLVAIKKSSPGTSGKLLGIIGAILSALATIFVAVVIVMAASKVQNNQNSTTGTLGSALNDVSNHSADSERQADIRSIFTQLENYFENADQYPTLAQINDPAWRAKNMPSLSQSSLQDPKGSSATLVKDPADNVYAYYPLGAGGKACNNTTVKCETYVLDATLSDGKLYQKTSLN